MIKPLVHDTRTLGTQLASGLGQAVRDSNAIHLVGHSMGGLIALEGLVGEMRGQRAQAHPTSSVCWVSLFASPVTGSMAAAIARNTIGRLWLFAWITNKQLRSLAKGTYCEELVNQARRRLYAPARQDSSARKIPIRMVMATNGKAVSDSDRESQRATFHENQPCELDYDHSTVKLPQSQGDLRYAPQVTIQWGRFVRDPLCSRG